MNTLVREQAAAANDAYKNRPPNALDNKPVDFDHSEYSVFGYRDNPATGFHATAYQKISPPYNIIIAFRGTDPDIKHHTRTTFQDAAADFRMVRERLNPQEDDARAFTQEMLNKAQRLGITKEQVTVAGHSLGGALAEIEAYRFGLQGSTFNGYGAADLKYGVPEGGNQVTNYVMAGDVVSAASPHFGQMKVLASNDDIQGLKAARYLDAPANAQTPNPLLAMRLADHSVTHFAPEPGSHNISVLRPDRMAQHEQNYQNHQAAIDHFRSDINHERADLATALRDPDSRNLQTFYTQLTPQVRQQLAEWHAMHVDTPVQTAIEQNRLVQGAHQGLDQTATLVRATGETAHQIAEQGAQRAYVAGDTIQQAAERFAEDALRMPLDPTTQAEASLVARVAGHVAHVHADNLARATHLAGEVGKITADFVAAEVHLAQHAVPDAHVVAQVATAVLHAGEAAVARHVDQGIDAYHAGKALGQAIGEHVAKPDTARNDPRNPASPDHALFQDMHYRFPEASEKRLLQFTAECHVHGINEKNLEKVHLHQENGVVVFASGGLMANTVIVDIKQPSPPPEQSIQQIQQYDQQQALDHAQFQMQQTLINHQQGR
jgi:hypothetical protein